MFDTNLARIVGTGGIIVFPTLSGAAFYFNAPALGWGLFVSAITSFAVVLYSLFLPD